MSWSIKNKCLVYRTSSGDIENIIPKSGITYCETVIEEVENMTFDYIIKVYCGNKVENIYFDNLNELSYFNEELLLWLNTNEKF